MLGARLQPLAIPVVPLRVALLLGASLIMGLLLQTGTNKLIDQQLVANARESALKKGVDQYSAAINDYLDRQLDAIDTLTRSPTTLKALKSAAQEKNPRQLSVQLVELPSALSLWTYDAKRKIKDLERIHLFKHGDLPTALEPNYLVQQQINVAVSGKNPNPQAAKLDSWNLFITRPVRDGGNVYGLLVVEIGIERYFSRLLRSEPPDGNLKLIQRVGDNLFGTLLQTGNTQSPGLTAPLTISGWELTFSDPTELPALQSRPLWVILALGLMWLGVAAFWYWAIHNTWTYKIIRARKPEPQREQTETEEDIALEQAESFLSPMAPRPKKEHKPETPPGFPANVFRDYDIRGKAYSEIDCHFAETLGRVLGSIALSDHQTTLAVARDGRLSSDELCESLIEGILCTGCNVIDYGMVPTPLLNFALANHTDVQSGVMVTASHNPASDNGFKIIFNQHVLSSGEISQLRTRMMEETGLHSGIGERSNRSINREYLTAASRNLLEHAKLKVVIDCGNGVGGVIAPSLFRKIGCEVIELHCEVDGNFPNNAPDPTVRKHLTRLIETVITHKADVGLAFDGDGDRLVAISPAGEIVWPDELLMIFARDILARAPGVDVVFDVKSTKRLNSLISSYGGRPLMAKTGHAHMRNKIHETGAPVGAEYSGHIFFNDRWFGFDDGFYAAARLLEVISLREQDLDEIMASFPTVHATQEIKVAVKDDLKFELIEKLKAGDDFNNGNMITLDGLRVEYPDSWGLVRASNTSSALTLRFEGETAEALEKTRETFKKALQKVAPELKLSF